MRGFFKRPFDDTLACLEQVVTVPSMFRSLGPMLITMVVCWFVYVPIHELLHVWGCLVTGGEVSQLEISPRYGGALFAKLFPFVVSGGDYAGRLSGFDTKGSDLVYLATVFAPFLLTVLIGVPLITICTKRRRPVLFGMAIVLGLAPFYNMPGDYFEMGSIITTRAITLVQGGGNPPAFEGIRSDDVFLLMEKLILRPSELGLAGVGAVVSGYLVVFVSLFVDVLLAFMTYRLGSAVADLVVRRRAV